MMNNFFDDVFSNAFKAPVFGGESMMKTDITENEGRYYLDIELPGYQKSDVKISLYNGDLTIEVSKQTTSRPGKLLRQERYCGNCSRTFYVGTALRESDIHASFNNGILTVDFPTEAKKQEEEKKFIQIL